MPEVIRRDPLVPLVAVVSAVVYALHGFHGALTRDLGLYSYAGQQVADGVPPYLGVLNRAGPLAHVLPGVGSLVARALGTDDVVTMRVLFLLLATAAVCLTYLLGRDLLGSRAAGLVAASALLSFHGFIQYASNGPREKTPMVLFVVLALWAATRRRWFTAGVGTSLATLCLQTAFFSTFTAVVVATLLVAHGSRLRALRAVLVVGLGGLVPVAVLATWFALAGSLRASWEAFYVINRRYTVPDPIIDLDQVWLGLQEAYGASVWVLVGGAAALVLVSLGALAPPARRAVPALEVLPAMTAGLLAGLWWITKEYDSWADLFPLLPFSALGAGAVAAVVVRRLAPRPQWAVAAIAAAGCLALALHYSLTTRDDTLVLQREATESVLAELPDDATITSVEGPQPLVLTERTNPTRYQMFRSGLQDYMEDTWPGGLDGFKRDLVADRPDLISTGETVSLTWRRALMPDYVFVGRAPQWEWYARADLGEDTIARLREAAGYDPADRFAVLQDDPP